MKLFFPFETHAQLFLLSVAIGGLLTFFYDCLKIFRFAIHHQKIFIHLEDALFWISALFCTWQTLLFTNNGELRFFIFFGLFLGMILFHNIISPFFMTISKTIIRFIYACLHLFLEIIFTPFRLLFLIFKRPLLELKKFCDKKLHFILHFYQNYVKIKYIAILKNWKILTNKKYIETTKEQPHDTKKTKQKKKKRNDL